MIENANSNPVYIYSMTFSYNCITFSIFSKSETPAACIELYIYCMYSTCRKIDKRIYVCANLANDHDEDDCY